MGRLLWQQRHDIGPAARSLPAMVYMGSSGRTLLGFNGFVQFYDTWGWDGEGWVQVAETGPTLFPWVGLAL
jgi:hypothetical protein